ncbi:MAG: serine protease Do [Mariniblastus sp.]|jgi:serine protease Do
MPFRPTQKLRLFVVGLIVILGYSFNGLAVSCTDNDNLAGVDRSNARFSPLVSAVQNCQKSVVNLRGRKTVPANLGSGSPQKLKQVNGMGTGVVIDSRGYVLTNYHVVEGVKTIEVTTSDKQKTTAKLLAHDPVTDLAILKIETPSPLPTIRIGSSSDLMLAERVIAVGNAYGYEHTVTVGIVSALSRTVQVNDDQIYRNLIQTDAAINPGNSGGPLLNVNGEMIGINVAVRIGAQGIAFAIPVNDAIDVAAELMSQIVPSSMFHGLSTRTVYVQNEAQLVVESVIPDSPAEKVGLKIGDRIVSINDRETASELDFQTALLHASKLENLEMIVDQQNSRSTVVLKLEMKSVVRTISQVATVPTAASSSSLGWQPLGLKLTSASETEMANRHPNYNRGLRVTSVRSGSPAEKEGIMPGDILVAMHGWKTESLENLAYILQRPDVTENKDFMFYILRDKEPFWGQMRVANLPSR